MSVCCECCVLLGTGLCDGLITRPEESYRLCCVVVCDLETSRMRRPWPNGGGVAPQKWGKVVYDLLTSGSLFYLCVSFSVKYNLQLYVFDRLCGLVVRVSGYRYRG